MVAGGAVVDVVAVVNVVVVVVEIAVVSMLMSEVPCRLFLVSSREGRLCHLLVNILAVQQWTQCGGRHTHCSAGAHGNGLAILQEHFDASSRGDNMGLVKVENAHGAVP